MDFALSVLLAFTAWQILRTRYQRARIALLAQHLSGLKLEQYMETLTQGYARAINEKDELRQLQVLETYVETENAVAAQLRTLAAALQKEDGQHYGMGMLRFCVPYAERFLAGAMRDFRQLVRIHADGLRRVVDNDAGWDAKTRAYHLSAELYLFQHSCHWFCKSRGVADARLMLRHQVTHQKVVESVSEGTRTAYLKWMQGAAGR
jgi:hypothetical protein